MERLMKVETPVIAVLMLFALAGCGKQWWPNASDDPWYYNDNRGVDVKQDKPRIDPKNNTR